MKSVGRFFANLAAFGLTCLALAIIAGTMVLHHYGKDLPEYHQLAQYDPPTVTRLYSADGKLLAEYATQKRSFVPLSAIPKQLIGAFISAEDKNFYQHPGVDVMAIGRAALTNILHNRSVGGSTITQQVVKNFLLTNQRTLERKVKEAILAVRISKIYSKDKILELYLNEIYLGMGSYGVASAALNYFNKSLDELNLQEAAFLAALPKAPENYNPRRFYDRAKARRDQTIQRMLEDGRVTPEEAAQATAQPILLRARDETEIAEADFFAEEVRRKLADMYGSDVLYKGGLTVKTTVDPAVQAYSDRALRNALIAYDRRHGYRGPLGRLTTLGAWQDGLVAFLKEKKIPVFDDQRVAVVVKAGAESALIGFEDGSGGVIPLSELSWARKHIATLEMGPAITKASEVLYPGDIVLVTPLKDKKEQYALQQIPRVNGAMVVLDPHNGRVLAMSGGYSYGGTEFNRATQAKRQPGSSFKPFVYLAGMEVGFSPSTIVLDAPVEMSQGAGLPTWKPQNYKDEYFGPTTLRVGLEKSRNTMTVRLAQMIGIDRILAVGKRFGIYDDVPRNFSVVLGAAETTLIRMVNAYAMIVNGGKRITPALIERIDDRHGKIIYRRDQRACEGCVIAESDSLTGTLQPPKLPDTREPVVDPRVAYQMVSMMQGVVERGTATKAKVVGKPLAGKTGTTNDSFDTWFVGFSPDLVAGVYVGFDKPESLGSKETGGTVALPAFVELMTHALEHRPATPFRIPPGIQQVKVDLKTGQPPVAGGSGQIIYEAFRSGAPVQVPGANAPVAADGSPAPEVPPMPSADTPIEETMPSVTDGSIRYLPDTAPIPAPPVPSAPSNIPVPPPDFDVPVPPLDTPAMPGPKEDPVVGTGGLY